MSIDELFAANGGVATTRQLLVVMSPKALEVGVRAGRFRRVRRGVYTLTALTTDTRLAALDAASGKYSVVERFGKVWRPTLLGRNSWWSPKYDSIEWHANLDGWKHDRLKAARLLDCGWTSVGMIVDDVRNHPAELVARIFGHFERASLVG